MLTYNENAQANRAAIKATVREKAGAQEAGLAIRKLCLSHGRPNYSPKWPHEVA